MMKFIKTIHATTGHTLAVFRVLGTGEKHPGSTTLYTDRYVVKNFDEKGMTFFFAAKGYPNAPFEIHVWYGNGQMWSGYGTTLENAIECAIKDGWMYANNRNV